MSKRKNYNFNTPWDSDYWMESNGFFCGFNMPDALKSQQEKDGEVMQDLPPYNWRKNYLVDEYPACPHDWMLSEGRLASYFVPIQNDKGMWLDFNKNQDNKYHVAIVVSIQGVNAITGLPCNDPQLEQYIDCCPKHKKPFGPNRLCEECGFKWPRQNYICTTSTPNGYLWLDGFRAANGAVQQYILTEQTMRGVASHIIGSKRVYAIGISYFLSKNPKPVQEKITEQILNNNHYYSSPCHTPIDWTTPLIKSTGDPMFDYSSTCGINNSTWPIGGGETIGTSICSNNICRSQVKSEATVNGTYADIKTKGVEIAAGASIRQQVYDDMEPLDFWRDKPEALMCINYCLEDEAIKIIKQGKISKQGHPQGFLKEVPVGN